MALTKYNNYTTATLSSGITIEHPKIAVLSYCTLSINGGASHSGERRTITCGGKSITFYLDGNGAAVVSLLPFMRNDMAARKVQDEPIGTGCNWRGLLSVAVSLGNLASTETTLSIYYIYGDCPPMVTPPSVEWLTYNAGGLEYSYANIDWASHYTDGVPNDLAALRGVWNNITSLLHPTGDTAATFSVLRVCGRESYEYDLTINFAYDCRVDGVVLVRWLDCDGGIHTRKLTLASEAMSGSASSRYTRHHDYQEIVNGYNRGSDEWVDITAQRTITIGDNCIPANQWPELKTLPISNCIEVYMDGAWVRCNIANTSTERDAKKPIISVTVTLNLPAPNVPMI